MTLYQCPICKTVVWFDKPPPTPSRRVHGIVIERDEQRVPHCDSDCCDMDPVETES